MLMNHHAVVQFIHNNFTNITQDYPWEDTPTYSVFRHTDNKKWFALLMEINYTTLHLNQPGKTYILNLKSDPDLIDELTRQPGFLPAYHMNKTHWITVLLDGSADPAQIQSLISLSYQLTAKKYRPSSSSTSWHTPQSML